MGVSSSGKTTVGESLADRLSVEYADGDDFHPQANVEKMHSGRPLTDEDRQPWLHAIGAYLERHAEAGAVVSCSALKRSYRDVLRSHAPGIDLLHLDGSAEVLEGRLEARSDHFMPSTMLQSQLDELEPPGPDEQAICFNIGVAQPADIVEHYLQLTGRGNPNAS
ncbi:MAG: gluconokinase [Nocardioidaceae bacterium]